MAKRFRYALVKKKTAAGGRLSVGTAVVSVLLFIGAVIAAWKLQGSYGYVIGGVCLFAALLAVYGFTQGIKGFAQTDASHLLCIIGSIANGLITVFWLAFYLMGLR